MDVSDGGGVAISVTVGGRRTDCAAYWAKAKARSVRTVLHLPHTPPFIFGPTTTLHLELYAAVAGFFSAVLLCLSTYGRYGTTFTCSAPTLFLRPCHAFSSCYSLPCTFPPYFAYGGVKDEQAVVSTPEPFVCKCYYTMNIPVVLEVAEPVTVVIRTCLR